MVESSTSTLKFIKIWNSKEVPEGDGATVRRCIGIKDCDYVDPFLMLDHAKVKLPTGFPDHPHRGFETVSYLLEGSFHHEDFKGHKGKINPGGVQWMTAGKGVVHSEIPGSFDEYSVGLQLWINLNKENKMIDPNYQEFSTDKIPEIISDKGSIIKVISGEYNGNKGPVNSLTSVKYFHIKLAKGDQIELEINKGTVNVFIYCFKGNGLTVLGKRIKLYQSAWLNKSSEYTETIKLQSEDDDVHLILLQGHPLNEPVVKYGPFVMNTREEIEQAFDDYQNGKNGFEGAREWSSKNKSLQKKK